MRLLPALEGRDALVLKRKRNIFLHLVSSIISQQLSTKVADVIYNRFLELYDNTAPTPEQVLEMEFDKLRSIGLSNAKTTYVRNIAQYAIDNDMSDKRLYKMSNDEVMEFLLPIKGVGRWTVEMQLMFALGREDVFAVDDLGIQQAMIKLYKLKTDDKKQLRTKMLKLSEKWQPYRTYACMHLWRYKDGRN
ncbi:MAG: DNA-3-methyladenine glycosylase 2 family protein [Chitinophagales bacterium]|nr:DNA-3-methyladenine glycosylase 2 family protein [Chitinophagaceae bacterium]MCB9065550.1 DNA-3-methyladenine glycosylase 2 family protein [Chitinophagales bacterium]